MLLAGNVEAETEFRCEDAAGSRPSGRSAYTARTGERSLHTGDASTPARRERYDGGRPALRARPAIDALLEREVDDARRHVVAASTWIFMGKCVCGLDVSAALAFDAERHR
jgi:hypothetical protein